MNQAKIWLVVNPGVGLPLFLGTVLFIAMAVHYAVLSHTTWFGGYWQGGAARSAPVAPSGALPASAQAQAQ